MGWKNGGVGWWVGRGVVGVRGCVAGSIIQIIIVVVVARVFQALGKVTAFLAASGVPPTSKAQSSGVILYSEAESARQRKQSALSKGTRTGDKRESNSLTL